MTNASDAERLATILEAVRLEIREVVEKTLTDMFRMIDMGRQIKEAVREIVSRRIEATNYEGMELGRFLSDQVAAAIFERFATMSDRKQKAENEARRQSDRN